MNACALWPNNSILRLLGRYSKLVVSEGQRTGSWQHFEVTYFSSWIPASWHLFPPNPSESRRSSSSLTKCLAVVLVTQSCPTLCYLTDCSPPGCSVHGILQARLLEWVAIPCSRGSSWARDRTQISWIAGRFVTIWATGKSWQSVWVPMSWRIWDPSKWALILLIQGSPQNSRELTDEFLWFLNFPKILCKILNYVYFENSGMSFRSWNMSVTHPN